MPKVQLVTSKQRHLIMPDLSRWFRNSLTFSLVLFILIIVPRLLGLISGEAAWGGITLYAGNLLLDLIRKWWNENKYQVTPPIAK